MDETQEKLLQIEPKDVSDEDLRKSLQAPYHRIRTGIFLSGQNGRKPIANERVSLVISIIEDEFRAKLDPLPDGVDEKCYSFADTEDMSEEKLHKILDETDKLIASARKLGRGILVHCAAGVSRSATVVASYIMSEDGISADDAVMLIKNIRHQVSPNPTFLKVLRDREGSHRNETCLLS